MHAHIGKGRFFIHVSLNRPSGETDPLKENLIKDVLFRIERETSINITSEITLH